MARDDLMQHTTSEVDFYELLGVTFETCEADIRRAYRRTALRYHPDKLGKDFDPEQFHLLQIAHDVLSDPAAKAAYDNTRNARLQRQRQHELFDGKRRKMMEDLEARERGERGESGLKRPREEDEMDKEIRRLAEEGRRRKREMEEKMKAHTAAPQPDLKSTAMNQEPINLSSEPQRTSKEVGGEDEDDKIIRLERRIREAEEARARRKIEKKARNGGVSRRTKSPGIGNRRPAKMEPRDTAAAISPETPSHVWSDWKMPAKPASLRTATMERLKVAEKQRLENETKK